MAKVLKVVAIVAGVVAVVASAVATGGASLGLSAGVISAAHTVAAIASVVALAAGLAAAALTKPPPAVGNASQITIGVNQAMPYAMGRTYVGGALVHDMGYGATMAGVPNPYRSMVFVWSGGGPIDSLEAFQADFTTVGFTGATLGASSPASGYYHGFMDFTHQIGAAPESAALAGPHGSFTGWDTNSKLSGYAAGMATLTFDKAGKVYSGGIPQFGAIIKGVKAYDPRLDSTYPGGSGTHRWGDESTWAYTENPALHALTYARGRYQNKNNTGRLEAGGTSITAGGEEIWFDNLGKKVFGCGFPYDAIDFASFVALANICDANGWKVGGVIYEPGSRWDNLKRILIAAAAEPMFVGARLSVKYQTPRVALDTITAQDLADGEYSIPGMKSWKDRLNGIVPKYRSEAHKWEYVQAGSGVGGFDPLTVASYVTADGEEKTQETQYDLVQDATQAARLAAYDLVNGRELGPIVLPCKPRLIEYVPGEALTVDIPELGLAGQLCMITGRRIDPATCIVELTLETETTSKHAFALGRTGVAPPTPSLLSGATLDAVASTTLTTPDTMATIINSMTVGLAGNIVQTDAGSSVSVAIPNHTRSYLPPTGDKAVTGATITGLAYSTTYLIYYDDVALAGGAVTYQTTTTPSAAYPSATNPYRHFVAYVTTVAAGGTGGSVGGGGSSGTWSGGAGGGRTFGGQLP